MFKLGNAQQPQPLRLLPLHLSVGWFSLYTHESSPPSPPSHVPAFSHFSLDAWCECLFELYLYFFSLSLVKGFCVNRWKVTLLLLLLLCVGRIVWWWSAAAEKINYTFQVNNKSRLYTSAFVFSLVWQSIENESLGLSTRHLMTDKNIGKYGLKLNAATVCGIVCNAVFISMTTTSFHFISCEFSPYFVVVVVALPRNKTKRLHWINSIASFCCCSVYTWRDLIGGAELMEIIHCCISIMFATTRNLSTQHKTHATEQRTNRCNAPSSARSHCNSSDEIWNGNRSCSSQQQMVWRWKWLHIAKWM